MYTYLHNFLHIVLEEESLISEEPTTNEDTTVAPEEPEKTWQDRVREDLKSVESMKQLVGDGPGTYYLFIQFDPTKNSVMPGLACAGDTPQEMVEHGVISPESTYSPPIPIQAGQMLTDEEIEAFIASYPNQ